MWKDLLALIKEKPLTAFVVVLLSIIIWGGGKGVNAIISRIEQNANTYNRIETKVDQAKVQIGQVDDKVDELQVQVRTGAGNDSTVIREQARLYRILDELERRVAKLEER